MLRRQHQLPCSATRFNGTRTWHAWLHYTLEFHQHEAGIGIRYWIGYWEIGWTWRYRAPLPVDKLTMWTWVDIGHNPIMGMNMNHWWLGPWYGVVH